MNGVHDLGGMHGMGSIEPELNEPVFHEVWEARVFALRRAMGAWKRWNIDATRYEVELVPPADYLRLSYYARQFEAFLKILVKRGLVSQREIDTFTADPGTPKAEPALTVEKALALVKNGVPTSRDAPAAARFKSGERIRTRNLNPIGHTRLPRYARGKAGVVLRDHGVFVFPDTNAQFQGEKPQRLYSVRFTVRELWGDQAAPQDSVYLDLWDDYLEPL